MISPIASGSVPFRSHHCRISNPIPNKISVNPHNPCALVVHPKTSYIITLHSHYSYNVVTRDHMPEQTATQVKFEVYGQEMLEKVVKPSGNSGRVYLPPDWVDKHVKIIRMD